MTAGAVLGAAGDPLELFASDDAGQYLTILHTNDVHSRVEPFPPDDKKYPGMGGAAMIGLGLALAQPKRKVLVITGDGEMLMGIGALATIAVQKPANLSIVVQDNEHYGETGMQQAHTQLGTELAGVARAASFRAAGTIYTEAEVQEWVPRILREPGPVFADMKVKTDRGQFILPPRDGTELKLRFQQALRANS